MPTAAPFAITPLMLALVFAAVALMGLAAGWWLSRISHLKKHQDALMDLGRQLDASRLEIVRLTEARAAASVRAERVGDLEERLHRREERMASQQDEISDLRSQRARLETIVRQDRQALKEKLTLIDGWQDRLADAYKGLSTKALRENNRVFMDLAQATLARFVDKARSDMTQRSLAVDNMLKPLQEALERYEHNARSMERARENAYGELRQQVHSLAAGQDRVQRETSRLVKALQVPHVRGRWGETTLKRVAELSGMQAHCDFYEQPATPGEDSRMRPDMIVQLPGNRRIIVDAKVPLSAYLDALDATAPEKRDALLDRHAAQVSTHIQQLSRKAYWAQFETTPEFVVLFIPGENFFAAALSRNPNLIEDGIKRQIVLATPTTLIALLKAVAYGWRQQQAAENADTVSRLGRTLYERLQTMTGHLQQMGRDLDRCVGSYNRMVGSMERRVLSSARRFEDVGVGTTDVSDLAPPEKLENKPRLIDRSHDK
ncbi:MAG: DNA recombination protein RmuC [Desulfosarcina sp.]|nr:DNA recombination protein RmuC [Desulfobacterales bacterium]